jgi:hypothetical protein
MRLISSVTFIDFTFFNAGGSAPLPFAVNGERVASLTVAFFVQDVGAMTALDQACM